MATTDEDFEKIRCLRLMAELKTCISSYNQFHQYYIYGKFSDCTGSKKRLKNCLKWRTFQSEEAKADLIQSLKQEQKSMHTDNPIWKLRESPPSDW